MMVVVHQTRSGRLRSGGGGVSGYQGAVSIPHCQRDVVMVGSLFV